MRLRGMWTPRCVRGKSRRSGQDQLHPAPPPPLPRRCVRRREGIERSGYRPPPVKRLGHPAGSDFASRYATARLCSAPAAPQRVLLNLYQLLVRPLHGLIGKPAQHQADHRQLDPCLAAFWQHFVVLAEPATKPKPRKCALYYPTSGQLHKPFLPRLPLHDLQVPPVLPRPLNQSPAVDPIGPDLQQSREAADQLGEHFPRAHRILQGATVHDDHQQQPQGIHDDVALPALHLLASVEPTGPPFSVVWTDWLSITAALGVASRPSDCLTRSRKAS